MLPALFLLTKYIPEDASYSLYKPILKHHIATLTTTLYLFFFCSQSIWILTCIIGTSVGKLF